MTSIKDVERLADNLEQLARQMRSELRNSPDFEKLAELADRIGEHADGAAETFSSVDETLTRRISEIRSDGRSRTRNASKRASHAAQETSTQSAGRTR